MDKTYRIGVLGLTHDHVWGNLQELHESNRGIMVAAADPNQSLLQRVKKSYDCAVYSDFEAMLKEQQLNAVYVYSDNATGVELTEMAAARGLHVMVEKPMAANLEGADRMLAVAREGEVRLMINWPFAWWPQLQKAIEMATSGQIGDIWEVKYRAAHAGPKELGCTPYFYEWLYDPELNGAGALMDYCCYGTVLARCLLGHPSRVVGVAGRLRKEYVTVDDNAILVMTYPRAMAVSEASWTQVGHLTSYVTAVYGTKATLLVEPRKGGRLLMANEEKPDGIPIEVPEPPPDAQSASAHFLHCLDSGEEFTALCSDRVGRDAQEILEAGLLSIEGGTAVSLPL